MRIEAGKLFVPPTTLYRELQIEHLSDFRALQRMQYDFDEETLDNNMLFLQKVNYWEQLRDKVLSVVASPTHPRFKQVGFVMGYGSDGIMHVFGDRVIASLKDTEILVIEKTKICPEADIRVQILDEDWTAVLEEGIIVDYKANTQDQQPPSFSFILELGGQRRRHPDWGGFGDSRVRFDVTNLGRDQISAGTGLS